MSDNTTLGPYLRRERERRGLTLRTISESTKVSVSLLEGLETDDISRWPGGIFRRAFVRSYAQCVGLDADEVVRRFEQQHHPPEPDAPAPGTLAAVVATAHPSSASAPKPAAGPAAAYVAEVLPRRARVLGTAADVTVATVLAFGSAAAGSRLLWPVLAIAAYYAIGVIVSGTSPMVALLSDQGQPATAPEPDVQPPQPQPPGPMTPMAPKSGNERRHSRRVERARHRRNLHARAN